MNLANSPYLIEYSQNIAKAIDLASGRGLFNLSKINFETIKDYKSNRKPIPMWVLEAACEINRNDNTIPLTYQNIWFCIHNSQLIRTQPSGRIFKTKANLSSCSIEYDLRIKEILANACSKLNISKRGLSSLAGYKKRDDKSKNNKIPLKVILKACQILNLDVWQVLEGYQLVGKTNYVGSIVIPKNEKDIDIELFLIWVRTEGHVELGSTHIEINQKDNKESLYALKSLIRRKFNLRESSFIFSKGNRGEDRLIISSSPLKQLLCLKYNLPLGYKSGCLEPRELEEFLDDDYKKMMAAFIQTEGCLSYQYTRNKKRKLPRFEFIVKDKALAGDCFKVMKKLGFSPNFSEKQNIFKVGLYNHQEVIRLVKETKQYFFSTKKINYLKEVCSSDIGL